MSARHQRDPNKEQFWRKTIQQQQASGQTVRAFCQQQQINEVNFHSWRREIQKRDQEKLKSSSGSTSQSQTDQQPAFVPVHITPEQTNSTILITLPNQTTIRLEGSVEQQVLTTVLQLIGGERGC